MKILAFSDLHLDTGAADRLLAMAADADLVLGAGDFADRHMGLADFMDRLEPIAGKAVYVPGNNESVEALRGATSATVLHGQSVERGGLTILGLGAGIPPLGTKDWESWDLGESAAETLLAPFEGCDILLTHSPPQGIADEHSELGPLGSEALRRAAERLAPRLMVFGHVHDCWGQGGTIGETRCRNLGPEGWWAEP
ncbi:metallophosphoesterase family protein [Wenxinia saemankumensis]|uniref:Predicted phosphoesterase n=1 Tax=Wenxinia saemankumensis TaxID=1447782 RepID=A0A1M6FYY1_9RHOB|nr:metallophosphoesterase [Wenxinia saemankumensis]SHJ02824.1 Predicted phosphoesterase [Wenxinia saemankumensis]